jgi:hypothetical protein
MRMSQLKFTILRRPEKTLTDRKKAAQYLMQKWQNPMGATGGVAPFSRKQTEKSARSLIWIKARISENP